MNNKLILLGSIFITLMFFSSSFGSTITYTYDNLNRLTQAAYENGIIEEFTYDAAGNRQAYTVNTVGTIQVNPEPNEANGSWTLTGPNGYSQSGTGDQQISNLTPGSYTITWNDITNWIKPTPSTEIKSLASGDSVTFTGIYSLDTEAPTVTGFTIPETSTSLTVPIMVFSATDNVTVMGYLVNESAVKPSAGAAGWSASPPANYIFTTEGVKTLYAWAKDAAGNVSNSMSDSVTITLHDTTPDQFIFTDQTNMALSTVITSNTITISGINSPASISITGGTYSINGGAYTSSSGTVSNGNTVSVRLTSSGSYSMTTNATLTIGGVSDTFTVRTLTDPQKKMTGLPWLQLLLGD